MAPLSICRAEIDRIDMTADGAVRIIDYKSGGKKFDPTRFIGACSFSCCCIWRRLLRGFPNRARRASSIAG